MAPAANHRLSQDLCDETFLLSNISPQVGAGFNRDKWEHLERYVRGTTKIYKNVYVCTGPLYLPKVDAQDGKSYIKYQVIGSNNVAVPTHFFKVLVGELDNQQLEMEAYVLPNEVIPDNVPLAAFQVKSFFFIKHKMYIVQLVKWFSGPSRCSWTIFWTSILWQIVKI